MTQKIQTLHKKPLRAIPVKSLSGTISVPGDKSISHRSLMLSTLTVGESQVEGLLESEDILATANAMRAFGAQITKYETGGWSIKGLGVGGLLESTSDIDYGNAGTGVRLALGMATQGDFVTRFVGDDSLSKRPMGRVLTPLKRMGLKILEESDGKLPLKVRGPRIPSPIRYEVPVPSAQVKSAILFAGLNTPGETIVVERIFTRDHTEKMLTSFGANILIETAPDGTRTIHLQGHPHLKPQSILVPGDPSSAAFPLVAALIVPDSDITIQGILMNKSRTGLIQTLLEMGGDIEIENQRNSGGEEIADLHIRTSDLKGIHVPAERTASMIDEYPILAVAAAFAHGPTYMEGLTELRVKESDRLATTAHGLIINGVDCTEGKDCLIVNGSGSVPGGGMVPTDMDHRIMMSFLIMGLAAKEPVCVDDTHHIATSFPNFVPLMETLGAEFETYDQTE